MTLCQRLTRTLWRNWAPPPPASAVDWIPRHVVLPDETETPGPFDFDLVPHVRGPLEAVDDPHVRTIYLLWAARNAKTTTVLACLLYWSATQPRPSVFASANEELADRTIQEQLYPLLEKCEPLADQLPPPHRRNKRYVKLLRNRIRRAFAGARGTFRGYPACYAVASEVSAWPVEHNVDASALRMLAQRGKLYPFDRKYLYESTPGLLGACQMTELFEADGVDRRSRWVPCPHCGHYQLLTFGTPDPDTPGIKWERDARGRSNPSRAEETAWYRCVSGCRIDDCDRPAMMRAGVWVSEGQSVRAAGKGRRRKPVIEGEARFPRSSTVGFGPLSTLYSLLIAGWGQIARDFLEAKASVEGLRDFTNSTLALPWDPRPREIAPDVLAERLVDRDRPSGVVPAWGVFLTLGVDVQEEAQRFPWAVCAWGANARGALIDHGEAPGLDGVRALMARTWPTAPDAPHPAHCPISLGLIDSGYRTDDIYRFAWSVPRLRPAKGGNSAFDQLYRLQKIDAIPGMERVEINTHKSQDWIQRLIDGATRRDDPAFFSLPNEAAFDLGLLEQLMNETRIAETGDDGYPRVRWVRRNSGRPNDVRDAIRYAWTAAQLLTQHGARWASLPGRPIGQPAAPPKQPVTIDAPPANARPPIQRRRPSWIPEDTA